MNYPRILFVHMTKVRSEDQLNLLIRSLFGDWPKENIGQIYTGCYPGKGEFCGHYFEIGPGDRRFGRVFGLFKMAGLATKSGRTVTAPGMRSRTPFVKVLSKRIVSTVIGSGIWEVVFRIRRSKRLVNFVHEFKPDIIFTQGYNLGLTGLALELAEQFSLPIFYFPVDDWHSCLYHKSPIHREVDYLANIIAKRAALRFALGPKMSETLTERYQVGFECVYNADDLTRFNAVGPRKSDHKAIVFGFTGSLNLGRVICLVDLLSACESLNIRFVIKVYCLSVLLETPERLLNSKHVEFLTLPSHADLPQALSECDILFLPESFDPAYRKAIELSLSTKSHLFMMSGRPILVYGPEWSGTVDYARRFGWGVVVDRRDDQDLLNGITKIMSTDVAKEVVSKGHIVVKLNHDIHVLRKHVLDRVKSTVQGHSPWN